MPTRRQQRSSRSGVPASATGDTSDKKKQSGERGGSHSSQTDDTAFHPPRSSATRGPSRTSHQQVSSSTAHASSRAAAAAAAYAQSGAYGQPPPASNEWPQPSQRSGGGGSRDFSPPRSRRIQTSAGGSTSKSSMEGSQSQNKASTGGGGFDHTLCNLDDPRVHQQFGNSIGSFADDDSPPRNSPSDADDTRSRRRSPRGFPSMTSAPHMPTDHGYLPPPHHAFPYPPPHAYHYPPPSSARPSYTRHGASPPPGAGDYPHYHYPPPPYGYPPEAAHHPPPWWGAPPRQSATLPESHFLPPDAQPPRPPVRPSHPESHVMPPDSQPSQRPPSPPADTHLGATTSTPEKSAAPRSVFRSPHNPLRQSPVMAQSPEGGLGMYGSFGMMDTPGGTLADLSPQLGPTFALPHDEAFKSSPPEETRLPFTRSESLEEPLTEQPKLTPGKSPFAGFLRGLARSPVGNPKDPGAPQSAPPHVGAPSSHPGDDVMSLRGVTRSPVQSGAERRAQAPHHHHHGHPAHPPRGPHSTSSVVRYPKTHMPPGTGLDSKTPGSGEQEAKPRKLWPHESTLQPSHGSAMRIELGRGSQLSLEGINSMMRGQSRAPMNSSQMAHRGVGPLFTTVHPNAPSGPPVHASHPPPPSFATPHKPILPTVPPPAGAVAPSHAQRLSSSRSSGSLSGVPPSSHSSRKSSAQNTSKSDQKIAPFQGKENPAAPEIRMRNSCNCKKSKCLKLYCECFSGNLYCDGCNCHDCQNLPAFRDIREQAVRDIASKNPHAFKPRFEQQRHNIAGLSQHSTGCRCKRSECLKKYCECFQAGVLCTGKCKCSNCLNHAGSQKLIDKRRKMRDTQGAEYAMRVSEEAWKGHRQQSPNFRMALPSPSSGGRPQMSPPSGGGLPHLAPHGYMRSPYLAPQYGVSGYSPAGITVPTHDTQRSLPIVTGFPQPPAPSPSSPSAQPSRKRAARTPSSAKRSTTRVSSSASTKKTIVRKAFSPSTSRKKRKTSSQEDEVFSYYGPRRPPLPKTAALAVFSYLSNKDIYQASLVCKTWSELAHDDELWQFA